MSLIDRIKEIVENPCEDCNSNCYGRIDPYYCALKQLSQIKNEVYKLELEVRQEELKRP